MMDKNAPDATMPDVNPSHKACEVDMDNKDIHATVTKQSLSALAVLQSRPNHLLDLSRELRDKIYGFCFDDNKPYVVFRTYYPDKPRLSGYKTIYPEQTSQIASNHHLIFSGEPKSSDESTDPARDWSRSITGILYANKQISAEAALLLYQPCTFFFEAFDLCEAFLNTIRPCVSQHVRKIALNYPEEMERRGVARGWTQIEVGRWIQNRALMRKNFISLCKQIVISLPKSTELTIWVGDILGLEVDYHRCEEYEEALSELSGLRDLVVLEVKKYGDTLDNSRDEDALWHGTHWAKVYTIEGVKELVRTGDCSVLDRMRKRFEENHL